MADQVNVGWPACDKDGCIGVRLDASDRCLADAGDTEQAAELHRVAQTGKIDARGVTISSALLKAILDSTPCDSAGHVMPADAQFDRATFLGEAKFDKVIFQGKAGFDRARFLGNARFNGATFHNAWFYGAIFQRDALFSEADFRNAWFRWARFEGGCVF